MKKFLCSILAIFVLSGLIITEGVFSGTYYYPGEAFDIPLGQQLVTKDLNIPNNETITQVVLLLYGEVTGSAVVWDDFGGFTITLRSPYSVSVVAINSGCYYGSVLYDTRINDLSSASICSAIPPATGAFQPSPDSHLSDFNGYPINGNWSLIIYNEWPADSYGQISSWGLWFATASTPDPMPTPESSGEKIGIFKDTTGLWAIKDVTRAYFGSTGDEAVLRDYNGDGIKDIAIFRPSSGLWAIRGVTRAYFGSSIDSPFPLDVDGDGCCDIGIFRESSGLWAIRGITRTYFGSTGDTPVKW